MMRKLMSSDEIYEDLCAKIISLQYMPGEKISENELSTLYGVSRHVIRAAITRLKVRNLVDVYPQRGTYIALLDMKYIESVLFIRQAIECEAISRLEHVKPEKFYRMCSEMRACIEEQKRILNTTEDREAFYLVDGKYHRAIGGAVGQSDVMDMISEPFDHIRRWRNFEIRSRERLEEIIQVHEEILAFLEDRDWEKAKEMMHFHLDTVKRMQGKFKDGYSQYFIFTEEE